MVWNLFKRWLRTVQDGRAQAYATPVRATDDVAAVAGGPIDHRVRELVATYDNPKASAAYLLCDRHPSNSLAYRVIGSDLAADNLTYGELRARSERLAAGLASLGIGPGDRVATLMGKSVEYLVTLIAIWRLGAVHVPLFTPFPRDAG
jgi:acetyl-CoA synthetase